MAISSRYRYGITSNVSIGLKMQFIVARTCIINMRNATCVETQTSKVSTRMTLYFLFCGVVYHERSEAYGTSFSRTYLSCYDSYGKFNRILLKDS